MSQFCKGSVVKAKPLTNVGSHGKPGILKSTAVKITS